MNYSSSNYSSKRGFPAGNPIANALVIIVGALVIGASIVLGFFAFIVLATILVVFSAFVGIRLWWFNRKLKHRRSQAHDSEGETSGVIEGEYHEVVEQKERTTSHTPR